MSASSSAPLSPGDGPSEKAKSHCEKQNGNHLGEKRTTESAGGDSNSSRESVSTVQPTKSQKLFVPSRRANFLFGNSLKTILSLLSFRRKSELVENIYRVVRRENNSNGIRQRIQISGGTYLNHPKYKQNRKGLESKI